MLRSYMVHCCLAENDGLIGHDWWIHGDAAKSTTLSHNPRVRAMPFRAYYHPVAHTLQNIGHP